MANGGFEGNHWDYFRIDSYCDVFIEDDHYLYAECEPCDFAHLLCTREYRSTETGGGSAPAAWEPTASTCWGWIKRLWR